MSSFEVSGRLDVADAGWARARQIIQGSRPRLRRASEIALTAAALLLVMFGALLARALLALAHGAIH